MLKRFRRKKARSVFFVVLILAAFCPLPAETEGSPQDSFAYPANYLLTASFMGDEAMVQMLLEAGVDKDARTTEGDTALHVAMFQGNMNVIALLLENGFDPNVTNHHGETPLHRAVIADNEGGANLLLKYNADKNIRNHAGHTPLHVANTSGKRRMILLLR